MLYFYRLKQKGIEKNIVGAIEANGPAEAAMALINSPAGTTLRLDHGLAAADIPGRLFDIGYPVVLEGEAYSLELFASEASDDHAAELWRVLVSEREPMFIRPHKKANTGSAYCVVPEMALDWWIGEFDSASAAQSFCKQNSLPSEVIAV